MLLRPSFYRRPDAKYILRHPLKIEKYVQIIFEKFVQIARLDENKVSFRLLKKRPRSFALFDGNHTGAFFVSCYFKTHL